VAKLSADTVALNAASALPADIRASVIHGALPVDNNQARVQLDKIKARPDIEQLMVDNDVRRHAKDPSLFEGKEMPEQMMELVSPRKWANASAYHKREVEEHNHSIRCEYMKEFTDTAILGLVREYGNRYDEAFCSSFEGQFEGVLNWSAFREVGAPCKTEGASNNDGWVCMELTTEVPDSVPQLRWVNKCSTKKLIEQLRQRASVLEGYDPFSMYPPGSPVFDSSKREEFQAVVRAFRSKLDELGDVALVELWQMIYRGVQLHEVGHNLGLRHNFESSTDALNFGEDYWDLKLVEEGDGYMPVNLWEDTDTENQAYRKMRELETASVMEYTRKFNGRNKGLGLYDYAAIRYGYGELVEVFNNPPDLEALEPYTREPAQPGNQSVMGPSDSVIEDAFRKVHHTKYVEFFDNSIENIYDRKLVRRDAVDSDEVMVPYRFCSDEYAGYTPTCQRHDEGVDPFEIVVRHAENYENYWPFEGYAHDQLTWSASNYAWGVQRYYYEMRKVFQYWVQLARHYNQDDWWAKNIGNGTPWDQDINGGLSYTMGARKSFNVIANSFGRPAEARYGLNAETKRYEPIYDLSLTQYTNQAYITQEDGARPFYESFDFGGYLYSPYQSGAIYDRIYGFAALTDPTNRMFLNVEEVADQTRYLVNYYTVYPDEMMRLVGGLMTSDEQQYGWWICSDSPQQYVDYVRTRDFFDKGVPENCKAALNPEPQSAFPNAKYRMPALAALYGMALMTDNFDKSFLDASRLCLEGSGDCLEIPEGLPVARFADPLSGKVYVATKFGDDDDYDPAYALVQNAQKAFGEFISEQTGEVQLELLQNEYYFSELQFLTGRLELMRSMYRLYTFGE
jgi:hypothetical protein